MDDTHDNENEMHTRVGWLKPSDYPILKEISEYGGWMKPSTLALNIPYTRDHISWRCKTLAEHGLLERHEDVPGYRITEKGRAYLAGDLDVEDLEE
jgi:predicted transcriptional regulator